MSARDDFGSNAGTPRGYGGGGFGGRAGGLGNGGVGGGMGGGMMGGGAARNGGIGSQTGLGTGNRMYGGMAMGRPGGPAMNPGAWGVRPQPSVTQGPLSGMPRQRVPGVVPASVPGVNPVPENVPMPPAYTPNVFNQNYLNQITNFTDYMRNNYGWGASNPNVTPGPGPAPSLPSIPPNLTMNQVYGQNYWNNSGLLGQPRNLQLNPTAGAGDGMGGGGGGPW